MDDPRPIALADGSVIHADPEILGGTPVFVGTRVPVSNMVDYLLSGYTVWEFVEQFPSVRFEQAERLVAGSQRFADLAHAARLRYLPPLTPEQKAEIERRLEAHRRDPSSAIPWEEVRARLAEKFGWDPDADEDDPPVELTPTERAELDRCIAEHERDSSPAA
jgi:putative addiction module component (TIGR02574 family)